MGARQLKSTSFSGVIITLALLGLVIAFGISCRPDPTAEHSAKLDTELEQPPVQSATPTPPPGTTPDPLIEQRNQIKKKLAAAGIAEIYHQAHNPDKTRVMLISISGYNPSDPQLTRVKGKPIAVVPGKGASTTIQLPSDVYVEYTVLDLICAPQKKCPPPPIIGLVRGNSKLALSTTSGQIVLEEPAPGEKGAFDFLKNELPSIPYSPPPPIDAAALSALSKAIPKSTPGTPIPTPTPTRTPPPFTPKDPFVTPPPRLGPPPGVTVEDSASRLSSRGAIVTIAGKRIKIPDDAYIDNYLTIVDPLPGMPMYDTPIIGIKRGKSRMGISVPRGIITNEEIAPGEKGIFDWLDKELPPQKSGIRTRGSTIIIKDRLVELPEDAFIFRIWDDYIRPSDPKLDPFGSAQLPVYVITFVRKVAAITISTDGTVFHEYPLPKGTPGIFDFLKNP